MALPVLATRGPPVDLGYVTRTLHKLSAGTGYEYLTRQVAALDSTEKGTTPLADYYAAKGEAPGHWVGSGLVGVDGVEAGDTVTAEQMKHLFGTGAHPLTGQPLGLPYKIYGTDGVDGFNVEVGLRLGKNTSEAERARVRSEVAREFFVADHDREPRDARELSAALARYSRPRQTSVAGYDLTLSPVKSVSTLWAVAPPEVARLIEQAHDAAVVETLAYLERAALFTREGTDGARQVETRGLIATAFWHRKPGPATRTCTLMSRSPTRYRPARASGSRSTAGCLMLAPTGEQVGELSARARAARSAGQRPGIEVALRERQRASIGDTIIERRLGVSGTDWFNNGDRWIVTGTETRQLLYTMLTRGRLENHVHVVMEPAQEPHELMLPGISGSSPSRRRSKASLPATARQSPLRRRKQTKANDRERLNLQQPSHS